MIHFPEPRSAVRKGSTIADFGYPAPTEEATRLGTMTTNGSLVPWVKNTLQKMTNNLQSDSISFENLQLSTFRSIDIS